MIIRIGGPRWSWIAVFVVATVAPAAPAQSSVEVPAQSDWTDHGVIISLGPPGSWDHRLDGALTTALMKKDGTYFFYYIGASGDRGDGGPAFRKLGVITCPASADCTSAGNWTRYAGNPILTHEIPSGCDEAGIFSAAPYVDEDGTVYLYFGGMQEGSGCNTLVDSDGVLSTLR